MAARTAATRATALAPSGLSATRPSRLHEITRDYAPGEAAREPVFWVMYLTFVLVGAGDWSRPPNSRLSLPTSAQPRRQ